MKYYRAGDLLLSKTKMNVQTQVFDKDEIINKDTFFTVVDEFEKDNSIAYLLYCQATGSFSEWDVDELSPEWFHKCR